MARKSGNSVSAGDAIDIYSAAVVEVAVGNEAPPHTMERRKVAHHPELSVVFDVCTYHQCCDYYVVTRFNIWSLQLSNSTKLILGIFITSFLDNNEMLERKFWALGPTKIPI